MNRTDRFLKGFSLGYLNLAITTIAGVFLIRFYFHNLGQTHYGYWLIATQLLGFAALLDLGVVALLPREIAYVTGTSRGPHLDAAVAELLERVLGLILLQTPLVSLVLLVGWLFLPGSWEPLRWPLALLLAAFAVTFPLRLPAATLTGLQDLGFLSSIQLTAWTMGTLLSVALLCFGWKLGALTAGYLTTQFITATAALLRLRGKWPSLRPRRIIWPNLASGPYLRSSLWATVIQIAQIATLGTEGVIIGSLFGAALVVPYAMTNKLYSVLGNQPNLVMHAAAPGLAEARTATDAATRLTISIALGQGMLTLTASIVIVIIAINHSFVSWWLGAAQYAGLLLTVLLGLMLFLRQWNTTLVYALFSFGHERRIALVALADGVLTVCLCVVLARRLGLIGLPLGSILAVLLTSLPLNLSGLHKDTGEPLLRILGAHFWWQWRALMLAGVAAASSGYFVDSGLASVICKGAVAALACVCVLGPLMLKPPLGPYIRPRMDPLLSWLRFSCPSS